MATTMLRKVVREDGAVVRLWVTSFEPFSLKTWSVEVMRPTGGVVRVSLFEAEALRVFDRAVAEGVV